MAVGSIINADGAGPDLAAADVALAGFGTGASVAVAAGSNDSRGKLSITAGTTPAADATATVTFKRAKVAAPAAIVVTRGDADQAAGEFRVSAISATDFELTFEGTAVATEVYDVYFVVVE